MAGGNPDQFRDGRGGHRRDQFDPHVAHAARRRHRRSGGPPPHPDRRSMGGGMHHRHHGFPGFYREDRRLAIYVWAFISGMVWMVIRPAYKVIVTQVVPPEEVRPAVSLNSVTETSAMVLMNTGGSALISWLGLPVAFLLNSASYLVAIFCLGKLKGLAQPLGRSPRGISMQRLFPDLKEGFVYLTHHKELLHPLLLTLVGITIVSPATSLLAHRASAGEAASSNWACWVARPAWVRSLERSLPG